jgi:molybdopterin molybdotransferase
MLAMPYTSQSSGVLSSSVWADGLAIAREGKTFSEGDTLEFLPFSELMS